MCWIGLPGLMRTSLRVSDIPTAVGLMLTAVAVGGVVLPPAYAALVDRLGTAAGWDGLAAVSIACAVLAIASRRRGRGAAVA